MNSALGNASASDTPQNTNAFSEAEVLGGLSRLQYWILFVALILLDIPVSRSLCSMGVILKLLDNPEKKGETVPNSATYPTLICLLFKVLVVADIRHTKERTGRMKKRYVALLVGTCLVSGCMRTLTVRPDLCFIPRERVNQDVGLYLTTETKSFVAKGSWGENRYQVLLGQSMESNASKLLSNIFNRVAIVSGTGPSDNLHRVLSMEFTKATKVQPARTVFSDNSATVGILVRAYDHSGKLVWQESVEKNSADASAKGKGLVGLASPAMGAAVGISAMNSSLNQAAEDAFRNALEGVNDVILLKEGRSTPFR